MASLMQKALILPAKQGKFVVGSTMIPSPGPLEVLVRVESAALNPVEWKIQAYGVFVSTYPAVLGTDGAGIVEDIGSDVTTLAKGDRIFWQGFFEPQWARKVTGVLRWYLTLSYTQIPSGFSFDEVATLPVAIATAVLGMYNHHPSSKSAHFIPPWVESGLTAYAGKPALIMGGASSVGQSVIQLARLAKFSPIITTASPRNAPLLTSLGATHVLDRHLSHSDLLFQIASITAGTALTFAYDAIADPDTQHVAFDALASGGTLIITWDKAISAAEQMADESKTIVEVFASVYVPEGRETGVAMFKHLSGWLESGALKSNNVEVLPGGLSAIPAGLERVRKGLNATKLVVHPQETTG
ncbi:GroES-like protein [Dichomitus squalens LYAD-421 SS1]|uniref:GroES-like protein n=1 Tax=Dichomitus squalens (strain LYAD-421) TaxID=732165 RepID=UPI0004411E74|nr:GroES-like protein [Dichomitus squalens LYAD-421 SS1]EJF65089.1 GroES-like protein [Dichomitus squalens LYAD-421 SS1]